MKRGLTGIALLLVIFSCGKKFVENEDEKYLALNIEEIRAYDKANNLNLKEHSGTGIFWKKLVEVPNPKYATSDLTIHIAYSLKTLGGNVLFNVSPADSNFFGSNSVANVFQGFLIAVNSLGEGEKGVFYLPSTLVFAGSPPDNLAIKPWEVTVLEMEVIKHYTEGGLIDLFLERNNLPKPEVTDLGVRIVRTVNRPLDGDLAKGDLVTVKYKGYYLTNQVFDQGTIDVTVGAGGVIPGFDDAIAHMRVGEKATAIIPWQYGYGSAGSNSIPPFSTLVFDIEIVSRTK